jgi:hypothetical protein
MQKRLCSVSQPVKFSHPRSEKAETVGIDRTIDPSPHTGEIEILITLPQPGAGPTFRKLFTDRLDGEPRW